MKNWQSVYHLHFHITMARSGLGYFKILLILKNNAWPDFEWFNIDITSRWFFISFKKEYSNYSGTSYKQRCIDKGRSTVNYRQSSPFDRPYLSLMIFKKGGFSRKCFFLLVSLLFLRSPFEQSWTCFPGT